MALEKLTIIDGGGLSTTSDYRVGVITATKFVGPVEGSITATDATFSGNVSIAGTLTYEDVTNVDSVGIITGKGADINGDLDVDGHTNLDNVSVAGVTTFAGAIDLNADLDVDGHTNLDNVSIAGVSTFSDNINAYGLKLTDNKSIILGTSDDMRIRHTGSHSEITDEGTGDLRLGSGRTVIGNATFSETQARFIQNGAVELYHDNIKRLETSSVGVSIPQDLDVDGHTNLDNVSVAGVTTFAGSSYFTNQDNYFKHDNATVRFQRTSSATQQGAIIVGNSNFDIFTHSGGSGGFRVYTGGAYKLSLNSSGTLTATTFSGSGASLTNLPAANLTGTLPAISGANLTNLPAQATIANNADNRVITGGSGVNLNGESNLTFDGSTLGITKSSDGSIIQTRRTGNTSGGGAELKVTDGFSSTSPVYSFWYNNTTGIGNPAANTISFINGGVERLRIDSSGNVLTSGNTQLFGSNTSDGSDDKAIMINGGGTTSDSRGGYLLVHGNEHSSFPGITRLHAGNVGTAYIAFNTAGSERLRIDSNGRVVIGYTQASTNYGKLLHIHNSASAGASVHLTDSTTGTSNSDGFELVMHNQAAYLVQREPSAMIFMTNGTNERLRINSSGSIQITPEGSTSNPYMLIDTSGDSVRFSAQKASGNNEFRFLTQSSGTVAEKLRIRSTGEVTMGQVDSSSTSALHIRSITSAETTLELSTKDNYNGSLPSAKIVFTQQNGTEIARIKCDTNTGAANMADLTFWTNYGGLYERMRITKTGEVLPGADNSFDLGSSSKRWRNLYTTDLQLSNKGSSNNVDGTWGDWTLQEGEHKIFMINNRTGKRYSLKMEEE